MRARRTGLVAVADAHGWPTGCTLRVDDVCTGCALRTAQVIDEILKGLEPKVPT